MCIGGSSAPALPPQLPEAAQLPEAPVTGTTVGRDKRRRAAATGDTGAGDTILTSSRGVTQPGATATKTLLGE